MTFRVAVRKDLSLLDLKRLHDEGGSVQKSPHGGNVYNNNLAVGTLGIQMNLYDRTIGEKDMNFHPHRVIRGGRSEVIADPRLLTTHARVLTTPKLATDWFREGELVLDGHMRALRSAVPEGDWFYYTEYLHRHADEVVALCEASSEMDASIWERHVDAAGRVHQDVCPGVSSLKRMGIYGVTNAHSGWLLPNVLNVLCDALIERRLRRVSEVFHLSGPDMVRYVPGYQTLLERLYAYFRHRLDWDLPESFTFNLVPAADMRFAVTADRRGVLDELFEAWFASETSNRIRGDLLREARPEERSRLIGELAGQKQRVHERLKAALLACPDIFYRIEDARSVITQYDVLDRGLYVHPWGLEVPLEQVSKTYKLFERLR